MKEFKNIFINLRKERGYSQEAIAKLLNVSKSSVAMWETGKRQPSREVMEEIADLFNVDMDYIYGKSEIKRKIAFDSKGNEYIYSEELSSLIQVKEDPAPYLSSELSDVLETLKKDSKLYLAVTKMLSLPSHLQEQIISLIDAFCDLK